MPLLMIPSNHNASFTLVTESGLAVYDNVLSSNVLRIPVEIPQNLPPNFLGSRQSPLWVQWAKPCRHSEYLKTNDDFFLVREDGALEYFEIKHSEPTKPQSRFPVGSLNMCVDSAFAILEGPLDQGGDICVVGGDMTNGAVCHLKARRDPEPFQTIKNLAPIRDMLVLKTSLDEDAKRMFVCSGKGEGHAAVAEIRKGLEARLGVFAELGASSAATGLWLLPETVPDQLTVLISYPLQTSAMRIDFRESTMESADDDLESQGLQLSSQTVAFAFTNESLLIQITSSAVAILSPVSKKRWLHKKHEKYPVLVATISPDDLLFATVAMVGDGFEVLLSSIDIDEAGISVDNYSEAHSMIEEPSSILIFAVGDMRFLTIGTVAGSIHILAIETGRVARFLSGYSITRLFPHVEESAISSLAFLTDPSLRLPVLACGTRNGWLLAMTIVPHLPTGNPQQGEATNFMQARLGNLADEVTLLSRSAQRVGRTTLALISEPGNLSAALIFCDDKVHRILYSQPDWVTGFQVSRIWFTGVAQVGLFGSS
jgi:Mono-functional DNA-alkylating methyl methanesulfonate N-term